MFNKKLKKRIEELERRIEILVRRMDVRDSEVQRDTFTKNIHFKEDMVYIKGKIEYKTYFPPFSYNIVIKQSYKDFYFLKGTEPKCDSIIEKLDGTLEFIKNNVACDKEGNIKTKLKK